MYYMFRLYMYYLGYGYLTECFFPKFSIPHIGQIYLVILLAYYHIHVCTGNEMAPIYTYYKEIRHLDNYCGAGIHLPASHFRLMNG